METCRQVRINKLNCLVFCLFLFCYLVVVGFFNALFFFSSFVFYYYLLALSPMSTPSFSCYILN